MCVCGGGRVGWGGGAFLCVHIVMKLESKKQLRKQRKKLCTSQSCKNCVIARNGHYLNIVV